MGSLGSIAATVRQDASIALLVLVLISLAYTCVALLRVALFRLPARPDGTFTPPVTLLKPVCGLEPEPALVDCLRSFCQQDYPAYQVVFGVREAADPAVPVIERLLREHPNLDATLVIDPRVYGANRKLSNLTNMVGAARHEILISADADGQVGPNYLREVVAPFSEPKVGAVTCLYRGKPLQGVWSFLGAAFMNDWFLPSVLIALTGDKLRFLFGNTMAIRRDLLEKIGGFRGLTTYLADDYLIGRRVSALGFEVRLASCVVDTVVSEPRLGKLFRHELRWGRTFRTVQPAGWYLSIVTDTTVLAVLYLFASGASPLALWLGGAAIALRLCLHALVRRRFGITEPDRLWLLPARDLLFFAVRIVSFFGRGLEWKNERFVVVSAGRIEAKRGAPQ